MSYVFGALFLVYVPFILWVFGVPAFDVPTPSPVIPYLIGWLAIAFVWIVAMFLAGWWWGPFDYPWVPPMGVDGADAERRHARWVVLIAISAVAITPIVLLARAFEIGIRSTVSVLVLASYAALASALVWFMATRYKRLLQPRQAKTR